MGRDKIIHSALTIAFMSFLSAMGVTKAFAAPDMLPKCELDAVSKGLFRFHITSARMISGAGSINNQWVRASDVKGTWRIEYEMTNLSAYELNMNDGTTANIAIGPNGTKWGGVGEGDIRGDMRPYPSGATKHAHITMLLYSGEPLTGMMKGRIPVTLATTDYRVTPFRDPYLGAPDNHITANLDFSDLPTDCADEPTPRRLEPDDIAVAANGTKPVIPRQSPGTYAVHFTAEPGTTKYAAQAGFIWAYEQGVYPDYEQALAWYQEADRRQKLLKDFSYERDIARMIEALQLNDVGQMLTRGQSYSSQNQWEFARFYFGRAAHLGDVQGMAALGWVYGERFNDPALEVYWCRKAFLKARAAKKDFEIDAVNYFCPLQSFSALMTAKERAANQISINRAKATSGEIQRKAEDMAKLVFFLTASGDGHPQHGEDPREFARRKNGDYRQASGLSRAGPDSD